MTFALLFCSWGLATEISSTTVFCCDSTNASRERRNHQQPSSRALLSGGAKVTLRTLQKKWRFVRVECVCILPAIAFSFEKRSWSYQTTHTRFFADAFSRCDEKKQTTKRSVSEAPKPKHTYLIERNPALNSHSERYRATVTRKVTVVVVVVVLLRYRGDSGDRLFHRPRTRARSGAEREKKKQRKKMETEGENVSAQPGSLPPMSAAGGGAFATINVSPFLW